MMQEIVRDMSQCRIACKPELMRTGLGGVGKGHRAPPSTTRLWPRRHTICYSGHRGIGLPANREKGRRAGMGRPLRYDRGGIFRQ